MQFGIIGSGSWATAIAKILTDNNHRINWWIRNCDTIKYLQQRRHNPHYLSNAYFETNMLQLSDSLHFVIAKSDVLIVAVPSAYVENIFSVLNTDAFKNKKIVSAIKGLLPETNQLLNEYLEQNFAVQLADYFAVSGPCHAEEVAAEKLSYLTFASVDESMAQQIATYFKGDYINTIVNHDIMGVQYAAVLKNIYALGAGIAHGLDYGDNFLSVYIANAAHEMVSFVRKVRIHEDGSGLNYAASAYLGDLLVTCYSLYSRNRTFGNMIGKGYSVKAARLELNMVAEGYNASRSIYYSAQKMEVSIPIAQNIYNILWEHVSAAYGFKEIETVLI